MGYDGVGHLLTDSVTVPEGNPANINLAVTSIHDAYKICGRLLSVSSEDSSGDVVNELYFQYDTNGNLDAEYEEANGAVNTSTSLYVGYGYDDSTTDDGAVSTTDFRPTTLQYPTTGTNTSRVLTDNYGTSGGMDDEINQLDSILDGSGTATSVTTGSALDTFSQMGDGSIVGETFNQPDIGYNLLGSTTPTGASTAQPNLDQFGRVQDMVWSAIGSGDILDGYGYTRNLQGDLVSRQNLALDAYKAANPSSTAPYLDQVYTNDLADQLTSLTQGQLNAATDEIMSGTTDFLQDWDVDGNGNVTGFSQTGSDATTQTRTPTVTNEIGSISTTSGTAYAAPGYDAAGNMTTTPQPGDETNGLTTQFDAWDRLAAVYSSSVLVASYSYNGQNQLIATASDYVSGSPQSVVFDYYAGVDLIEQRAATGSGAASATGDSLPPTYQFVWSASGSNVPILRDTYSSGSLVSGDRIYFLTDANDNVTAITDSSGNVLERYNYSAFGGVTVYSATWADPSTGSSYGNTILFAGMNQDPTTALYYDNARWYNSSLGTFITTDPAHSSSNSYEYAGNDPTGEVDPTGLFYTTGGDGWTAPGAPATPATPAANPSCGSSQGPGEFGLVPTGFNASGGVHSPPSQLVDSGGSSGGGGSAGAITEFAEGSGGDESGDDDGDGQAAAMGDGQLSYDAIAEVDSAVANLANVAPGAPHVVRTETVPGRWATYDQVNPVDPNDFGDTEQGFDVLVTFLRWFTPDANPATTIDHMSDGTTLVHLGGPPSSGAMLGQAAIIGLAAGAIKGLNGPSTCAASSTTILGNGQVARVVPFAEETGASTIDNGLTAQEWDELTPQQQNKINDGQLRQRINEGHQFRDIGPDGRVRALDLRKPELYRLQDRGVPVETVAPGEVQQVLEGK